MTYLVRCKFQLFDRQLQKTSPPSPLIPFLSSFSATIFVVYRHSVSKCDVRRPDRIVLSRNVILVECLFTVASTSFRIIAYIIVDVAL